MPVTTSIMRTTSETQALQTWMWNHRLKFTRLGRSLVLRMLTHPDSLDTQALPRHAVMREPRAQHVGARLERHQHTSHPGVDAHPTARRSNMAKTSIT